jgi:tetratricopeptide (TPR) repeat protein
VSQTFSKVLNGVVLAALCFALSQCVSGPSLPSHREAPPQKASRDETVKREEPSPRAVASLQLTERARLLLQRNKPDEAIRDLEKAMNLNPSNGRNYFFLAEAWLMKGNVSQAREFNNLAALHLRDDPEWSARVKAQEQRISSKGSR